ncbi:MAG: IclR family transcriptional regulator [Chloroflexi bacterium]|nr:IclR family transcriptional regulator [Chloroflexota bacterium]
MQTQEPYPGTQAVQRAIALLKTFSDEQPELGLSELARAVNLNKSTAYRLLTALESEGMLARNPATDGYRLGPEIIALGGRALRGTDLRSAARPELERLAAQTLETATLEIPAGNWQAAAGAGGLPEVLILDEVAGGHTIGASQEIGTRWPAHATSTGKALLAALPEAEREAALGSPFPRPTERTLTGAALATELDRVRAQGYAVAVEELEPGYTAVGAALRDYTGRAAAAISVGGPSVRFGPERVAEIAALVKAAAEAISRRLGYAGAEVG